jgi:hypothetical protein
VSKPARLAREVARGIDLGGLVKREFTSGEVRYRGMRLGEPCTVVQRYVARPVFGELGHRGGLRADIIGDGRSTSEIKYERSRQPKSTGE